MSLLPYLVSEMLDSSMKPSHHRIVDQHFGRALHPEDLLTAVALPRALLHTSAGYYRPWKIGSAAQNSGSTVSVDKDKFQVILDVEHFAPEEITVKVTGENIITVEGKHDEKQDEHGFVTRQFARKYVVPKGHDISKAVSNLSSDGVLTITAPKIVEDGVEERTIPVTQTGMPAPKPKKHEAIQKQEQHVNALDN